MPKENRQYFMPTNFADGIKMESCTERSISTENVEQFFRRFDQLRVLRRTGSLSKTKQFFVEMETVLSASEGAARFNLFDIAGVGHDEVRHSAILAWLLSPHSRHGSGPPLSG